MARVSIIIPTYNEERFISETIHSASEANTLGFTKEIIVIDDGSTDKTPEQIKKTLAKLDKKSKTVFKTIIKQQNEGKGAAVKSGILESKGDVVIIQDADPEYSPDDYPLLLEPFVNFDADVVYGSRFISNRPHRVLYFWHYQVNLYLTTFSNMLTNLNLTDMETGFKAFKGNLIRDIATKLESKRFGFEPEVTAKISKVKGLKIFEVGVSYSGRTYEEGKKIGWVDGLKALWEIIKYNLLS